MKRFFSFLLQGLNRKLNFKYLIISLFLINNNVSGQKVWIGAGAASGNGGTDFNAAANWNPAVAPTSTDNITMILKNDAVINLSSSVTTINKFKLFIDGNNTDVRLNVGANELIVNDSADIDIVYGNPNTLLFFGVNNSTSVGKIDFKSFAAFGKTDQGGTGNSSRVNINANSFSQITFRGNVMLGPLACITPGSEFGEIIFDGTGVQNLITNNNSNLSVGGFDCSFKNVTVGNVNSPVVNLIAGTKGFVDPMVGNLTLRNAAVLNVGFSRWNRSSLGGSLALTNTSKLILSNVTGGIAGSNFPSNFATYTLDSTSTVEFNGASQTIPGFTNNVLSYGNLTLSNGNIKTLGSNIAIFRCLTLANNTTMALGASDAVLKSNNVTTAYVAAVPATPNFTYGSGRFEVERHLFAQKSWRLLATPIEIASSPTIAASWRENNSALTSTGFGTQITGPAGPITPSPSGEFDVRTQRGSLKSYNANTDNYDEVLLNTSTTKIANKTGYYVFVRGGRGVGITDAAAPTNLRMKGKLLVGDQIFTIPVNKFQSFGNPFASRVDFRTIYNSSISPSYYVWNPNPAGSFYGVGKYELYSLDLGSGDYKLNGTGAVRNYLESGQAVFIQSITGGSITVKESDKFGGSSLVSRVQETSRPGVTIPTLEINLFVKDANADTILADAAVLNFDTNFSNQVDNMDVRKISNTSDNLSILTDNKNLVVSRRGPLNSFDTIFLKLKNTRIGEYCFNIDPSVLSNLLLKAHLKDKFLNTETPVSLSEVTNIRFEITNNSASRVEDRFMIFFKSFSPVRFTTITALRITDKSASITWNTENENNINTYKIERSDDTINFIEIGSQMPTANNFGNPYYTFHDNNASKNINYYRVKGTDIAGNIIYSNVAIIEALEETNNKSIGIFPNPVIEGIVHIYFDGAILDSYNISIYNIAGQLIKRERFNHQNINKTFKIKLSNANAGVYSAIIESESGVKKVIPFIIK